MLEQQRSLELSVMPHIFVLCGHYEGVDQRILDEIVDEEVSICLLYTSPSPRD